MKKIISTIVFCLSVLTANAQLFTSIKYFDKFDDVLKTETCKTLITRTDSTFIIEEKGKKPKVYYIVSDAQSLYMGDKDNIVNLANNVYGYQSGWWIIKNEDKDRFFEDFKKVAEGKCEAEYLEKYLLSLVHRVISRYQFSFYYDGEYLWIENESPEDNRLGTNVNRIIYIR